MQQRKCFTDVAGEEVGKSPVIIYQQYSTHKEITIADFCGVMK
jgi:hypothetical protein